MPRNHYWDLISTFNVHNGDTNFWLDELERCRAAEFDGDSEASLQLRFVYLEGIGVDRNPGVAVDHFAKAAANGNAYGYFHLGRLARDRGDYAGAVKQWRKASEMGDTLSESFIGIAYLKGEGVERSEEEAFEIFRRTAAKGDPEGRYRLAICYRDGIGTGANIGEAIRILAELKDENDERAHMKFAKFHHDRVLPSENRADSILKCVRDAAKFGLPQAKAWLSDRAYKQETE